MKLGHRTAALIAFAAGACLFVSTAFADMLLGSGYDRLKSAVKTTAAQMESGLESYTSEGLFTLEVDGQTVRHTTETMKVDTVRRAKETVTVHREADGTVRQNYSYQDPDMYVWKAPNSDVYYVSEHLAEDFRKNWKPFDNPFDDENAGDIERIVDALVGGLKDHVQAAARADGGVEYSGRLSAVQVPPLVNAVTSFLVKQWLSDSYHRMEQSVLPRIVRDIHVHSVTGTAVENGAGFLESLTGEVALAGKDEAGVQHEIALRLVYRLSSVGSTAVTAPDLTDAARVEKGEYRSAFAITGTHAGVYRNDIVLDRSNALVKIGERTLEITSVEGGLVKGRFRETVFPGFEQEYPTPYEFEFELVQDPNSHWNFFTYTVNGETRRGQLHPGSAGRMYVDLDIRVTGDNSYSVTPRDNWQGDFYRVFE